MLRACECAMNSNSLDLNANVRRVGGWVDTGHSLLDGPLSEWVSRRRVLAVSSNEFAIEFNCITHSCQQNARHSIRLNSIEIDLHSLLFTLLSFLSPFHCPLDVTLCIHTFFVEQWNNLKCLWYSEISAACWMKFKSSHAPNRRRCAPPIPTPCSAECSTEQRSSASHRDCVRRV